MEITRALIIDGNALMYKCYYAVAYKKENINSDLIDQFLMIIRKIIKNLICRKKYTYGVIVFDSSKKTFRTEKLKDYKAQRPPMPEDLVNSIATVFKILEKMGIKRLIAPKLYEADDLIGSLATKFNELDVVVDVYTTDGDLLQLVNYQTTVNLLKKGLENIVTFDHNNFQKLTDGLLPYQIPFYKALCGDSSDNYKGIPSCGTKTSTELVTTFKNKQNLFKCIQQVKNLKIQKLLIQHEKDLDLFLEIAEIVTNLEITGSLTDYLLNLKSWN